MATKREAFEQCIGFVSELEGRESELDLAKQVGIEITDDDLARAVVQKLKQAIKHVKKHPLADDQARTLYYVALYADAIRKPAFGICLCYIVINHPTTRDEYRELATNWLVIAKQTLPEETYDKHVKETKLDIDKALDDAYEWLKVQQKHATQPATKHVFNSDLVKKSQSQSKS